MIYAVNKRTKEHKLVKNPDIATPGEEIKGKYFGDTWLMVQADADGWIPWDRGNNPLPNGQPYQTKHESGDCFEGGRPETFGIHWRGKHCDKVVAYRPILDDKEHNMSCQDKPSKERLIDTFRDFISAEEVDPKKLKIRRDQVRAFLSALDADRVVDLSPEYYAGAIAFAEALSGEDKDQEWSGEGMPPVGVECEGYVQDRARQWRWAPVDVLMQKDGECAVHVPSTGVLRWCDEFRPIRTAAQRAGDVLAAILSGAIDVDDETSRAGARVVISTIREGRIPGVKLEGVGK